MTKPIQLLKDVEDKLKEFDFNNQDVDNSQNIISLLGKGHDEVAFCKILWYILNLTVDGKKKYLGSFLKKVLFVTGLDETEIDRAFVYREYIIPGSRRRIDLVIKTRSHFIPIEAKIYSDEHGNQCADYLEYAGKYYADSREAVIYYLTIEGQIPPEDGSYGSVAIIDRIKCISWEDIRGWLFYEKTVQTDHSDVIGQFYKAITVLLNPGKAVFEMDIDTNLLNSSADIRAALEISKAIERKKISLMQEIFDSVQKTLEHDSGFDLDPVLNKNWNNEKRINEYYDQRKSSYPGLNYSLGKIDTDPHGKEYYFVLRFEIDYRAFVGYGVWTVDKNNDLEPLNDPSDALLEKIRARVPGKALPPMGKDWWIDWEYVFSNNKNESEAGPDFKDMNDDYLALYDKGSKEEFIQKAVDCLIKIRESIN